MTPSGLGYITMKINIGTAAQFFPKSLQILHSLFRRRAVLVIFNILIKQSANTMSASFMIKHLTHSVKHKSNVRGIIKHKTNTATCIIGVGNDIYSHGSIGYQRLNFLSIRKGILI